MGTWGTGLFSDDLASDVRDRYRELAGELDSGSAATKQLVREYADDLNDQDTESVFWLALADTQWRCGRLEDSVKQRALRVIDSDQDLTRWQEDQKLRVRRRSVLEKLRHRLESQQPAKKKLPKPFFDRCDWDVGEIISYERKSGKLVLLRVIGVYHGDDAWTKKGEMSPIIEILDWTGKELPSIAQIQRMGIRPDTSEGFKRAVLFRMSERDTKLKRFARLEIKVERDHMSEKVRRFRRRILRSLNLVHQEEEANKTCLALYARDFDKELSEAYGFG